MTVRRPFLLAGLFLIIALGVIGTRPVVGPLAAAPPTEPFALHYDTKLLPQLGEFKSYAAAIDELGQVAGRSDTAAGDPHACDWDFFNSVLQIRDLGTLSGGNKSGAVAINASGQVLGFSNAADGKSHILDWHDGLFQDLGLGVAADTNVFGDVLGTKDGAPRSTFWERLPPLSCWARTVREGIKSWLPSRSPACAGPMTPGSSFITAPSTSPTC